MNKTPWYYQPWAVILSLFFVLGPFGLPLLYQSPAFSKTWKAVLTLLTAAYTVYLIVATIQMAQQLTAHFSQLQSLLG